MEYYVAHLKVTKQEYDEIRKNVEAELSLLLLLKKLSLKSIDNSYFEGCYFSLISENLSRKISSVLNT